MFFLIIAGLVLPPTSLAVYVFPEIYLQGKSSGGLKAYLPDSCGVEGFGLQVKSKEDTSWRTGNGTKIGKFWTWEDRARALKVGDQLEYSPRVWYRGATYTLPVSLWSVPELVEDFTPPELDEPEQKCPPPGEQDSTEPTTTKSKTSPESSPIPAQRQPAKQRDTPEKIKKEGSVIPRPKALPTKPHDDDHDDDDDDDDKEDSKEDHLAPTLGGPSPTGVPFSINCNWLEPPGPGYTKEEALERQLAILQCEMSTFLERTTKLTTELNKELLDLKKLNYATVARMQRLESLIRTIPRAVPFSYL